MSSQIVKPNLFLVGKILIPVFIYASLVPYLDCGFFADDSLNSQVIFVARRLGQTVFQFALSINHGWMTWTGRFYPVSFFMSYSFFAAFQELTLARSMHMACVILNVGLISYAILKWTRSWPLLFLFITLLFSFFQIRDPFDPIASYAPFLQTLFFFGIGAVLSHIDYCSNLKPFRFVLSLISYALSLLTYEISLCFLPAILFSSGIYKKTLRDSLIKAIPYLLITALYLGCTFYFRTHRGMIYEGIEPRFQLHKVFSTFIKQTSASFPISHFLFDSGLSFKLVKNFGFQSISTYITVLAGMALFYIGLSNSYFNTHDKDKIDRNLITIAWSLFLFPSAIISLSARWQDWIKLGNGYLPVYLTYFGLAILAAITLRKGFNSAFLQNGHKRVKIGCTIILCTGFGIILFINHSTNLYLSEKMNQLYKYPRTYVENAYQLGILKSVPKGAILISGTSEYSWNNPNLTRQVVDQIQDVFNPITLVTHQQNHSFSSKTAFYYQIFGPIDASKHQWWVLLAKIDNPLSENPSITTKMPYNIIAGKLYIERQPDRSIDLTVKCSNTAISQKLMIPRSNSKKALGEIFELKDFRCSLEHINLQTITYTP